MSPTDPSAPSPGAPLLTVWGLRKSFGEHEVLRSVDLSVRRGQVLALIGASGSGKTTVLRCLNGLEVPDAGTIDVGGDVLDFSTRPSPRRLAQLRDRSAMVFQHYNLFPHRTVLENVVEGPVLVQRRRREEATREALGLLERVGLADKRDSYPFELSGGQQQRVGIVRALALRPQPSCAPWRCDPSRCSSTSRRRRWTPSWSVTCCSSSASSPGRAGPW